MKWLKASPEIRKEEQIPERPLLHACCGEHGGFGSVTLDNDPEMKPMVLGDVTQLPFKDNSFAAAYMDCPWTASWKKQVAGAMKELLRVAPIVYVISPWTYGSSICAITDIWIAWTPGVNQTLAFIRYVRNNREGIDMSIKEGRDFKVVNMEGQYGSSCCGCEEVDAPRFIAYQKDKSGNIIGHEVCGCKCHNLMQR